MKKIMLAVPESIYDRLLCLVLSHKKSFSHVVIDMFSKDLEAQELYDKMIENEYQKLVKNIDGE